MRLPEPTLEKTRTKRLREQLWDCLEDACCKDIMVIAGMDTPKYGETLRDT